MRDKAAHAEQHDPDGANDQRVYAFGMGRGLELLACLVMGLECGAQLLEIEDAVQERVIHGKLRPLGIVEQEIAIGPVLEWRFGSLDHGLAPRPHDIPRRANLPPWTALDT